MARLELKVPPVLVALVVAALMWLVSMVTPSLATPMAYRLIAAVVLLAAGAVLVVSAVSVFARAGTTVNPTTPQRSSDLVTIGVYRFTRNPMYLAMVLALVAFAALLSNAFALVLTAVFVAYMNRFQIVPEERVLAARFGQSYEAYASRVRRWA